MQQVALVTGATGAIGPALVRHLLNRGYEVRALVRRMATPELPREVQVCGGDITDRSAVQVAVRGVDVVFHLAAKLHISNPALSLYPDYRKVNVEGTHILVEAAQQEGVRRFVFFSTISVYGATKAGEIFTEDQQLRPQTFYAQTKCEAEQLVLGASSSSNTSVILRLAAVYGLGVKGNYAQLVSALRRGRFVYVGDGLNRRTLVYNQDVAAAALLAAEHPKAVGQIYNVTDGSVHTFKEIVYAICAAVGRRPPRLHLPAHPIRVAATLSERALALLNIRALVSAATIDKLTEDVAVSGEKIQRDLGFRPEFDLMSGWQATLGSTESAQVELHRGGLF